MGTDALAPPPSTLVVTGASGWFGTALLHALVHRQEDLFKVGVVRALVSSTDEAARIRHLSAEIETQVGDIGDPAVSGRLLDGAQGATVVHAAAVIHPRRTSEFGRVNVDGTAQLVDAARRADAARFVYLSSAAVAGVNADSDDLFRANEPYQPYLAYGYSKMLAEQAVRRAGDLPSAVVRAPWFYGPHQPLRQTSFLRMIRRGVFPAPWPGDNRRSMVYIDDLVEGVLLAARHTRAVGRSYWVADERPYSMDEIVETVRRALVEEGLRVRRRNIRVPRVVGDLAERADRLLQSFGRHSPHLHVLGEVTKTIACDVSATRTDLGYQPRVGLLDGMRQSIRWCLSEGVPL